MLIQREKSIAENYIALLLRLREMDIEEQSSTAVCAWCENPKINHLPDKRCSTWLLSQYFTPKKAKEREATEQALMLIEKLNSL